jgi:hypothetical protein
MDWDFCFQEIIKKRIILGEKMNSSFGENVENKKVEN